MQSNGRSNLLFTDHAAEKQVYLCSTPSCEHSDASCSSFIDSAGYYVFPVALEDKLLVVYSYISLPDEAPKPSKVEMMDLNGTTEVFSYNLYPGPSASVKPLKHTVIRYCDVFRRLRNRKIKGLFHEDSKLRRPSARIDQ